jgi:indole-3-glycerol phosphate synthase
VTATYLDRILDHHRARAAADRRRLTDLLDRCEGLAPARGFAARIRSAVGLAVIAEIKRRSPSKGDLNVGLDPAEWAAMYESAGATCLSVLTDAPHFGGSPDDLRAAVGACSLPAIRKDFTVDARDVVDARLMGADCALLIAAALDDDELRECHDVAVQVGLDALVEVHDEAELERAIAVGATLIGVNQRDLVTFDVDHERAVRMGAAMPDGVVAVAESGVRGPDDARSLREAGYAAVLVGESIVTSGDPAATIRALRTA